MGCATSKDSIPLANKTIHKTETEDDAKIKEAKRQSYLFEVRKQEAATAAAAEKERKIIMKQLQDQVVLWFESTAVQDQIGNHNLDGYGGPNFSYSKQFDCEFPTEILTWFNVKYSPFTIKRNFSYNSYNYTISASSVELFLYCNSKKCSEEKVKENIADVIARSRDAANIRMKSLKTVVSDHFECDYIQNKIKNMVSPEGVVSKIKISANMSHFVHSKYGPLKDDVLTELKTWFVQKYGPFEFETVDGKLEYYIFNPVLTTATPSTEIIVTTLPCHPTASAPPPPA